MKHEATQPVQTSGRGPFPIWAGVGVAMTLFAIVGQCTAPDTTEAREAAAQAVVGYMEYGLSSHQTNKGLHEARVKMAREAADKYVFVDVGIFGGADVKVRSNYWGKLEYAGSVSNPNGSKLYTEFSQNGW